MDERPWDPFNLRRMSALHSADLASLLLLAAFVLLMLLADNVIADQNVAFSETQLIGIGIAMAFVPALIWLGFFYRRDALEPEPKRLVLQVLVLGALLAAAVGEPILHGIYAVDTWLTRTPVAYLLGSILVIGFVREFLKYAAVRFSVFDSAEFDEMTDGIIYTMAAGIGYATYLNIRFVVDSGGISNLANGAIFMTIVTLAHASFAGVIGYFLGRERFTNTPLLWTPLGVTLAAVLDGLFFSLRRIASTQGEIAPSGSSANLTIGLLMAGGLAVMVAITLAWLIRRDIDMLTAIPDDEVEPDDEAGPPAGAPDATDPAVTEAEYAT